MKKKKIKKLNKAIRIAKKWQAKYCTDICHDCPFDGICGVGIGYWEELTSVSEENEVTK
jgi:hypothetical protein